MLVGFARALEQSDFGIRAVASSVERSAAILSEHFCGDPAVSYAALGSVCKSVPR